MHHLLAFRLIRLPDYISIQLQYNSITKSVYYRVMKNLLKFSGPRGPTGTPGIPGEDGQDGNIGQAGPPGIAGEDGGYCEICPDRYSLTD